VKKISWFSLLISYDIDYRKLYIGLVPINNNHKNKKYKKIKNRKLEENHLHAQRIMLELSFIAES